MYNYDPISKIQGEVRHSLTQSVDLTATILDNFNVQPTERMQSRTLRPVIEEDKPVRDYALFGDHNKHINVTDGEHVYMRSPHHLKNGPSFEYTLMPTHMRAPFAIENELKLATLSDQQFSFSQEAPLLKIPTIGSNDEFINFGTLLFNVLEDKNQESPIDDIELELKMTKLLITAMKDTEAPIEQYERVMLPSDREVTIEDLEKSRAHLREVISEKVNVLEDIEWTQAAINMYRALSKIVNNDEILGAYLVDNYSDKELIDENIIVETMKNVVPKERVPMVSYFVMLSGRLN